MLCSSITSIAAQFGQVGYCAANNFLDAFSQQKAIKSGNCGACNYTVSINWDTWKETGMGLETVRQLEAEENIKDGDLLLKNGMTNAEAIAVFDRILEYSQPQVLVSTLDLNLRLKWRMLMDNSEANQGTKQEDFTGTLHQRPELSTEYAPPRTEFEKGFADILRKFFGYEQVGIHDNFFEYGVTSLTIIRIKSLLQEVMDIDIPIVLMFEYPSIYSLGRYMEEEKGGNALQFTAEKSEQMEETRGLLHESIGLLRQEG